MSLEAFADSLDAKQLVAICVDESEVDVEGPYWLALLSGAAFVLDEDTWHSGQLYRKGWIVAPGRWYKLKQHSERGYELLPEEVCIHTFILSFSQLQTSATASASPSHSFNLTLTALTSPCDLVSAGVACGQPHDLPQGPHLHWLAVRPAGPRASPQPRRPNRCRPSEGLGPLLLLRRLAQRDPRRTWCQ